MLYIFRPFIYPLFWAAVVAIMFYPAYLKLVKLLKREGLASILTVLTVLLTIFIPLILILILLFNESLKLYNAVTETGIFTEPEKVSTWLSQTFLAPYVEYIRNQWTEYAASFARTLSNFLFLGLKSLASNSFRFIFMSFIMFYTLFYFLKDGKRMLRRLMHLSPLGDTYENMLYEKFTSTARATLKSTLIVGGIQGTLGGLVFWITGVEGAFVWGVIMVALSLIPAIGPSIIWLPTGIIMLAIGNIWQGLTILLFGILVISTIDNFLRPKLVGRDTQMHPLIVLLSTLGGLVLFGISGFVIGPVIAALYLSVISIYDHYYSSQLQKN